MWIEELGEGKFRYKEKYRDPFTDARKEVSVTILGKNTKKMQNEAYTILQEKILKVSTKYSSNPTLLDIYKDFIMYQENSFKASTYNRNKHTLQKVISITGGDILIKKINASYINNTLYVKVKNPTTYNEYVKRFKTMINWAYKQDLIKDVGFLDKILIKKDNKKKRIENKFLEKDEANQIIDYFIERNEKQGLMIKFLLLTGLRIGEALALTKKDVDYENKTVKINKNYDYNNKVITSPKNTSSNRTIALSDELLDLIKRVSLVNKYESLRMFSYKRNDLLFPNVKGGYWYPCTLNRLFKDAIKELNINKAVTLHTFRHTHASLLIEQGIDIELVARRLGHENSNITREIYIHITNAKQQEEFDIIRNVNIL